MQAWLVAVMVALNTLSASAGDIRVLAAGSLKDAFTAIFADYAARHAGLSFIPVWGPSGALRDRIEKGEAFDIFASAALPHAQTLTRAGISGLAALFARNALCIVTEASRPLDSPSLAATLLDPAVRIGTSTPVADPGGDYAWELFRKIDTTHPGAFATLSTKAQQLMGSPTAKPREDGRHPLLAALQDHAIDLFIYYCSSAERLIATAPGLKMVGLPPELSVGPEYGLTVSRKASPEAIAFAAYLLSPDGQRRMQEFGFIPAQAN